MSVISDSLSNCESEKLRKLSLTSAKMELPCTPLERGVKNYFPEGVKGKKSQSPTSLIHNFEVSFTKSTSSSPELNCFQKNRNKATKSKPKNYRFSHDNQSEFSSSLNSGNDRIADENQDLFLESFVCSNRIEKEPNNDAYAFKHSSENLKSSSYTSMRCESVEPFFPDIFSTSSFCIRPTSSKSVSINVDQNDDVIQPASPPVDGDVVGSLPSCSSTDTMTSHSETVEDPILSSENSMISEENNEEEEANGFGFKVHVRIKPLDEQDVGAGPSSRLKCVQVKGQQNLVLCTRPSLKKENTGNNHWFKFDHVLDEGSSQKDTYDVTTQPLVEMSLQGFHSCLIAYGSPGSGKSHALFGRASSGKYKGLIIRAAEVMMATIDQNKDDNTRITLSMSFIQIYNEKIYDILDPSATDNIKFHDVGEIHSVEGCTEWPISNTEDVTKQLRRNPNRLRDAGRSHTIFTLLYRREEEHEQDEETGTKNFRTISGRLDFVDLAGVNRSTKHSTHDSTGNNATAKANRSLQVFGNVIWNLTDSKSSQPPPYRDSRLTRLLREALGGNCVTRLLVTASCCPNSAHETLNCLAFAKRAMGVKNFPARYLSVEKVGKFEKTDSLTDEKVDVLSNQYNENSSKTKTKSRDHASTKKESSVMMKKISSDKQDNLNAATLPPINKKTSSLKKSDETETFQNHARSSSAEVPNLPLKTEIAVESSKSEPKISRKKSSRDYHESEGLDEKKRSDKSKKSKRKTKTHHEPTPRRNSVIDVNSNNNKDNFTLPQIDTPDLMRCQRRGSTDQNSVYKNSSLIENENSRSFEVLKCVKERPTSSHSRTIDSKSSPRYVETSKDKSEERKDALTNLRSPANEYFNLSPPASNCCVQCQEREDKIKRDYDRMILFSKKDRDMKQSRIEELEVTLKKARSESAPVAEVQRLTEEKVKDHQSLKKQKELVEMYQAQLSTMIGANEWKSLQELRRKDLEEMENLKDQISLLKKNLEEQIDGATKMLNKKSEQIAELEAEVSVLRQKQLKTSVVNKSDFDLLQTQFNQLSTEKNEESSRYQADIKEISFKLTCATAQVSQMQEAKIETEKTFNEEKQNLNRELSILSQQVTELTKSKKKQELLQNISLKCDSSTNTEDLKSKLNGLAYTVHCLKCAAQRSLENNEYEEVSNAQEAELRILLLQDTKNRELLLQLKRERNLLRDVMKIMYCRQWFTEEGNCHVKRTLRKVGIDTRELAVMKKQ